MLLETPHISRHWYRSLILRLLQYGNIPKILIYYYFIYIQPFNHRTPPNWKFKLVMGTHCNNKWIISWIVQKSVYIIFAVHHNSWPLVPFSSPELKAEVSFFEHFLSSVRPSICLFLCLFIRPSVNFLNF